MTPGTGLPAYGIYSVAELSGPAVDFNNVHNWAHNYYNVTAGGHDLDANPDYLDVATGNLHIAQTSPCRDAGDDGSLTGAVIPDYDIDWDARKTSNSVDIGADEYVPIPPASVTITGPTVGMVGTYQHFSITVSPVWATVPITTICTATDLNISVGYGDWHQTTGYTWLSTGTKVITVEATNVTHQVVTATHTILIRRPVFLPLVVRQ
jgi:hypothetical protein